MAKTTIESSSPPKSLTIEDIKRLNKKLKGQWMQSEDKFLYFTLDGKILTREEAVAGNYKLLGDRLNYYETMANEKDQEG